MSIAQVLLPCSRQKYSYQIWGEYRRFSDCVETWYDRLFLPARFFFFFFFFHAQKMIIVTSIISEQYGLGVVYYSCVDAQIIFPVLFLGTSKCSHHRCCKRRQSPYNMCVRMCFCCECMHAHVCLCILF